jgi:hypothetical protein
VVVDGDEHPVAGLSLAVAHEADVRVAQLRQLADVAGTGEQVVEVLDAQPGRRDFRRTRAIVSIVDTAHGTLPPGSAQGAACPVL